MVFIQPLRNVFIKKLTFNNEEQREKESQVGDPTEEISPHLYS